MPKRRLTEDEHLELGVELYVIYDRLVRLSVDLTNRYGVNTPVARRAKTALTGMSNLRCVLDTQALADEAETWKPEWYYPAGTARDATTR